MFDASITPWHLHWSADAADVFHVDLQRCPDVEHEAIAWLSSEERARRLRLVCPQAQRQFTICRASLRALLTERLGCRSSELEFSMGPFGKPNCLVRGRPVPLEFNVSHSGAHGLIALSTKVPLGVDIEERRPGLAFLEISENVFCDDERAFLRGNPLEKTIRHFYRIWTIKEAVIKSVGRGFSLDPKTFAVPSELIRSAGDGCLTLPEEITGARGQRLHLYMLPEVGCATAALAFSVNWL
jgi:4'-phosphopantetheinyl transferase